MDLQSNHLLQIFPEEIWKAILENVRDMKDLANLSKSTIFFHQRLVSKQTMFLFPDVIEVLIKCNQQNDQFCSLPSNEPIQRANSGDRIWKFPWGLRLVRSEWNKAIETHFQKPKINLNLKKSRSFHIFVEDTSLVQNLLLILAKFGRTVEFVDPSIWFRNPPGNQTDYYLLLVKILENLPNLKELKINHYPTNGMKNDYQLTRSIESNPFPKIQHLEKLSIYGNLSSQICTELLHQNHNFQRLKLSLDFRSNCTFDFSTCLPNLKEFDVEYILDKDIQLLKQFGKNWKLTKFRGDFKMIRDKAVWTDIFHMLGDNWGNTLEDLTICFPPNMKLGPLKTEIRQWIFDLTKNERFHQMKVLKTMEINTFCAVTVSLDFLLPCQDTLEIIKVNRFKNNWINDESARARLDDMEGQIVEHFDTVRDMDKSNIWSFFPKLGFYVSSKDSIKRPANYGLV